MNPTPSTSPSSGTFHAPVTSSSEAPLLRREAQWDWFGPAPGSDPRVGELRWKFRPSSPASVLKSQAQAHIHLFLVSLLKQSALWREFSRSPEALALRKNVRLGSGFNELGEQLQLEGLPTCDLGAIREEGTELWVLHFQDPTPCSVQVLGQTLQDYSAVRLATLPRVLPFQIAFQFGTQGVNPGKLEWKIHSRVDGQELSLSETLAISGVHSSVLEGAVFRTLWTSTFLAFVLKRAGLDLQGGALTWGLNAQGVLTLVSVLSPQLFSCAGTLRASALGSSLETADESRQAQGFASLANQLLGGERFARVPHWLEWITEPSWEGTPQSTPSSDSPVGVSS